MIGIPERVFRYGEWRAEQGYAIPGPNDLGHVEAIVTQAQMEDGRFLSFDRNFCEIVPIGKEFG
jgi:hypothetical protein